MMLVQQLVDSLVINPAYFTGMQQVHTVDYTAGAGGDQVAADNAYFGTLHWRGSHVDRKTGFNQAAQLANRADNAVQSIPVGNAQIVVIAGRQLSGLQGLLYLWA